VLIVQLRLKRRADSGPDSQPVSEHPRREHGPSCGPTYHAKEAPTWGHCGPLRLQPRQVRCAPRRRHRAIVS